MKALVTGGDTELGGAIAAGFHDAGYRITLVGTRRDELEIIAKELDADAVVCDSTDAAGLAGAYTAFPQHLDVIVNVPAPHHAADDPRTYSLADLAKAWRQAIDTTVLSAVLTVAAIGDHLRSGGSIISVVPECLRDAGADAAAKAALAAWTAGQAGIFGARGITVNLIAASATPVLGYDGLGNPPPAADEITRLARFLTTSAARHITGQTLHVRAAMRQPGPAGLDSSGSG